MAVVHAEEHGSPVEKWGEGGSLVVRRQLRCDWADRHDLLQEIGNNGGQEYPHVTGIGCFARGATIEGHGQSTEEAFAKNQYPHALLTVLYSTDAPQGAGPRRFVTEEMSPTRRSIKVDNGRLKWQDANGPQVSEPDAPDIQFGGVDYVLTFHDLLALPAGSLIHNVANNAPVAAFLYPISFPTDTLLHYGAVVTRTVGLGILGHYRLQYRWTFNPETWSRWKRDTGAYEQIFHTTQQAIWRPYPLFDFTLFYP